MRKFLSEATFSLWRTISGALGLLQGYERMHVFLLSVLITCSEILQFSAILLIMPVISLMVDPDLLNSNQNFHVIQNWLGSFKVENVIWYASLFALFMVIAGHIASLFTHLLVLRFTERIQTRLAKQLMGQCLEAPYPWFLERHSVALGRLFQHDLSLWARELIGNMLRILTHVLTVLIGVVAALLLSPLEGILILGCVALVAYGILYFIRPVLSSWAQKLRKAQEVTMVKGVETLASVKDIKISESHGYFVNTFGSAYEGMAVAKSRMAILSQLPTSILLMLGQVGLLAVAIALWHGGSFGGEFTSQLALMVLITSRVVPAVSRVFATVSSLLNAVPWIDGILELSRSIAVIKQSLTKSKISEDVLTNWDKISFENVSFRYKDSESFALENVTFQLRRGKSYGLIGTSGSGKSTLVDLLLGLLEPKIGRVLVDGHSLADIHPSQWYRMFGYVPQTPYFTDDTILSNIAFGVPAESIDMKRVNLSIAMANLENSASELPDGIHTQLGDRGLKLSGGQRQRIAIARALYRQLDILVLDEATSSLDPVTQQGVLQAIGCLGGNLTTFIISHNMQVVQSCDHILFLERGRIVDQGSFQEVMDRNSTFGALVD